MIEATLVVDNVMSIVTSFPALPKIGDRVGFWHERDHVFALVSLTYFDQNADGTFSIVVVAKIETD